MTTLKSLFDDGVLTQDEFTRGKAKILGIEAKEEEDILKAAKNLQKIPERANKNAARSIIGKGADGKLLKRTSKDKEEEDSDDDKWEGKSRDSPKKGLK